MIKNSFVKVIYKVEEKKRKSLMKNQLFISFKMKFYVHILFYFFFPQQFIKYP